MPSINGHGPKRAILYARVSTDEQARSGYSLAQQTEALREYAARDGYEVVEEVADPGQSGASLERPGMDRVRDLVAAGGVSVVLAQDRDRFAREPAYHYLLRREFEEHGCKIRALNDRGDESPEGELTDGILDQLAKFERAKTTERTRRGRLRRAREGKIIPSSRPNFGFRYNAARDNYVVDQEQMRIVARIFYMVGIQGASINGVKRTFDREGLPTPGGARFWSNTSVRDTITEDVYKPHTYDEVRVLVSSEVAARLDPEKCYGIWWYNRRRATKKVTSGVGANGHREYIRQQSIAYKPREEWIAIPVPDAGLPREWVDAARKAIEGNCRISSAGRRFWELSGGILYCGECGWRMATHSVSAGKSKKQRYSYYVCSRVMLHGKDACPQKRLRGEGVETQVWEFVSGLLKDPQRLRVGLDAMIEQERNGMRGDPEGESKAWLEKLAEADQMRAGYQELAAKSLMTLDELGEKLEQLDETRKTAHKELGALKTRRETVEALERDRDILLESYAGLVPEKLDALSPEKRHRIYKRLRLRAVANHGGVLEISGALGGHTDFSVSETIS
jgi:site-specific DNA recombinase